MQCPCGHQNPEGARFCNACGRPAEGDLSPTHGQAAPELPRIGSLVGGRYRVGQEIGRGAFGMVFEAEDTQGDGQVALKFLNIFLMVSGAEGAQMRERFAREWAAGSRLMHPRICRMMDMGEERGIPYLVMERVPGDTLGQILARQGPLPLERGIVIVGDVLEALAHAHRLGVVHRDVKPSNVMVDPEGRARLMDFGIAKLMETFSGSLMTQTGLLGTPSYMSPEQASGRKIDHRSDLFSVGLLAYEVFTGRRAFEGHPAAIISQILSRPVPPAPQLPRSLQAWLGRACAREPDERYPSAEAMEAALRGHASELEAMAAQETLAAPRELVASPPGAVVMMSPAARAGRVRRIEIQADFGRSRDGAPGARRPWRALPLLAMAMTVMLAVLVRARRDVPSPEAGRRAGVAAPASPGALPEVAAPVPLPPAAPEAAAAGEGKEADEAAQEAGTAALAREAERIADEAARKARPFVEAPVPEGEASIVDLATEDVVLHEITRDAFGPAAVVSGGGGELVWLHAGDRLEDGVVERIEPGRLHLRYVEGERAGSARILAADPVPVHPRPGAHPARPGPPAARDRRPPR